MEVDSWSPDLLTGGTRGVFAGGNSNTIDYVTISTTGNAINFGDLTVSRTSQGGGTSRTRGLFGGGYNPLISIDFVTIASTGDAADFGDLTQVEESVCITFEWKLEDYFAGLGQDPATS